MGKRSNFDRIEKDFYSTFDPRAVQPLLNHLPVRASFYEPCSGDAALITQLTLAGFQCVGASDIDPKSPDWPMNKNALALDVKDVQKADFIITNPPWSRNLLHPMIDLFSALKPTWLLFDADWAQTKQSAPYMSICRKIVAVGRIKWIPNTTMSGKDNCAWHLFDQKTTGPAIFYGR